MTSENNKDLYNTVSKAFNPDLNNSEKNSMTNNNSTHGKPIKFNQKL